MKKPFSIRKRSKSSGADNPVSSPLARAPEIHPMRSSFTSLRSSHSLNRAEISERQQNLHHEAGSVSSPHLASDNHSSKGLLSGILSMVGNQITSITSANEHETPSQEPETVPEPSSLIELQNSPQPSALSIKGIQFKPVKELPVNTLGKGNLTLADFVPSLEPPQPTVDDSQLHQKLTELQKKQAQNKEVYEPLQAPSEASMLVKTPPNERRIKLTSNAALLNTSPRGGRIVSQAIPRAVLPLRTLSPKRYSLLREPSGTQKLFDEPRRGRTFLSRKNSNAVLRSVSGELAAHTVNFMDEVLAAPQKLELGLVYALDRKQKEFHLTFKNLPSEERLYVDYACALSKDILMQGKLYVSDHYVSFYANILGWVTSLSIPLDEIVQIEKKTTAKFIPNALVIQTLHNRYLFTSFFSRDLTFDFITKLWNHAVRGADIKSSISTGSLELESFLSDESGYDTDEGLQDSDLDDLSDLDNMTSSFNDSDEATEKQEQSKSEPSKFSRIRAKSFSRKDKDKHKDSSKAANGNANQATASTPPGSAEGDLGDLPVLGPTKHAPTKSPWVKKPNETEILTVTFPVPPGTVFELLFGDNTTFARSLIEKQKNFDISDIPPYNENSETGLKERKYSYTKPLNAPVGPKQTRCNITDTIEKCDVENEGLIQVLQVTHLPDVPSGNLFLVSTRFYMTWAKNNLTLVQIITFIDWTSKSWLKGPIETGTINGQKELVETLISVLNDEIRAKSLKKAKPRKKSKKTKIPQKSEKSPKQSGVSESAWSRAYGAIEQVADLIPIPFIPSGLKILIFLLAIFVLLPLIMRVLMKGSSSGFDGPPYVTSYEGRYGEYTVIPPLHRMYGNHNLRSELQIGVWDWIDLKILQEASEPVSEVWKDQYYDGEMKATEKQYARDVARNRDIQELTKRYSKQELREYVKLNEERLNELKKKVEEL